MVIFLLLLIAACSACTLPSRADPAVAMSAGRLAEIAREAKRRGETHATSVREIEQLSAASLDAALSEMSVVLAFPTSTTIAVTPDQVVTWQYFLVDRWLSQRRTSPEWCRGDGPPKNPDEGSIVSGFSRGTAVVNGVTIRELTDDDITFEGGRRYLLIGQSCPERRLHLIFSRDSALAVSRSGELSLPTFNRVPAPFIRELLDVRTLEAFQERLAKLPPS